MSNIKVLSIINLKGGVGKTISAINIAYSLTCENYKVLIIDNDKQGNTSKFFDAHDENKPSISEVLTERITDLNKVVRQTEFKHLDILPANMGLLYADKQVLMDSIRVQQIRLKNALQTVKEKYDYVVIDNAPDLSISVINAMVASDDILVPIKIDKFSLDGIKILIEQTNAMRAFNPGVKISGGFVTMYQRNNVNKEGVKLLQEQSPIPLMQTTISKTVKVDESTFIGKPLLLYAPKTFAADDYCRLTTEYLKCVRN